MLILQWSSLNNAIMYHCMLEYRIEQHSDYTRIASNIKLRIRKSGTTLMDKMHTKWKNCSQEEDFLRSLILQLKRDYHLNYLDQNICKILRDIKRVYIIRGAQISIYFLEDSHFWQIDNFGIACRIRKDELISKLD